MDRAVLGKGDPGQNWVAALEQIEADAPAAFLYATHLCLRGEAQVPGCEDQSGFVLDPVA